MSTEVRHARTKPVALGLALLTALALSGGACGGSDDAATTAVTAAVDSTAVQPTDPADAGVTPTTNATVGSNAPVADTTEPDLSGEQPWPSEAAPPAGVTIEPDGSGGFRVTSADPTAFDTLYAWAQTIGTVGQYGGDNERGGRISATTTRPELVALNGSEISTDTTIDIMVTSPTEGTILVYCTPGTGREC